MNLSSIEGQYLGPMPLMTPLYRGDLDMLELMISFVSSVVHTDQQGVCSSEGFGRMPFISLSYENGGTSSSPSCLVIFVKSQLLELTLTGVPVLNLNIGMPRPARLADSPSERGSPSGPLSVMTSPLIVRDSMYVPEQMTTALAPYTALLAVITPDAAPVSSVRRHVTWACLIVRLSRFSNANLISTEYMLRSIWALGENTAGPLVLLSILICTAHLSAILPMMPPNASTSLTSWPLDVPPMLGLHGRFARLSSAKVNRMVLRPSLAQA